MCAHMTPLTSSSRSWFAFIVHARDMRDLRAMPGASLIRQYSDSDEEFAAKVISNPPVVLDDMTFVGSPVRGELLGIPRLPSAMMTPDGHRAVVDAVRLAADRGSPVIGLGALTAPATAGGRALLRRAPPSVALTNGNGLTAAVAREHVLDASRMLGLDDRAVVAVVGATGSVGSALSRLLADDTFPLVLVGRNPERLTVFDDIRARARLTDDLASVREADIVVLLTHEPAARISVDDVKEGALVIDLAQPPNVSDDDVTEFRERGIPLVRGGIVDIPGYACKQDFRLPRQSDTFACLAETYVLAREGIRENSVGRPSPAYARRMLALAHRHGIAVRSIATEVEASLSTDVERAGSAV